MCCILGWCNFKELHAPGFEASKCLLKSSIHARVKNGEHQHHWMVVNPEYCTSFTNFVAECVHVHFTAIHRRVLAEPCSIDKLLESASDTKICLSVCTMHLCVCIQVSASIDLTCFHCSPVAAADARPWWRLRNNVTMQPTKSQGCELVLDLNTNITQRWVLITTS